MNADWDLDNMRMSYSIQMIYTAEIDNSHGIFYAPFNLNVMRIVVDLHNIKLGDNKICFNCCDLSDYNEKYKPYTFFHNLMTDKDK